MNVADETQPTTPTPDGSPTQPLSVTIVGGAGLPGAPVFPTAGIDETVEGGAYRFVGLDGSESWKDAEGNQIKAPKR